MRILINYRQSDLGGHASVVVGWLRKELAAANYGEASVSMDGDSIPDGEDLVAYVGDQITKADVLLAVIGPQWASEMTERAGSQDDFVRIEIEAAVKRGIQVIPVLLEVASMPAPEELPASVLPLLQRNALVVKTGLNFSGRRFIEALDQSLTEALDQPKPTRNAGHTETGPRGIELVWCPPGKFLMGSPTSEDGRNEDETQHEVTLSKGFWIGKYPVTQNLWKAVMGYNLSDFKGAEKPVEQVSWDDAQNFIAKIGNGLRLPTEAEWEYACRADSTSAYCFGDDQAQLKNYGWIDERTYPVGQKLPNAWGIYDMHGNVFEWCQDWCGVYSSGPVTDPAGAVSGHSRVLRGGCWHFAEDSARSASRFEFMPHTRLNFLGFRLARSSTVSAV